MCFAGEGFVLEIHHGGDFVEVGNGQFQYMGGEVCWVEALDPDKTSWIELNTFAWRLGYRKPPVLYWWKHPTNAMYLPITNDKDVVMMIELLSKFRKVDIYYVGGGTREVALCEMEDKIENYEEFIPHVEFMPEILMVPLNACESVGIDKSQVESYVDKSIFVYNLEDVHKEQNKGKQIMVVEEVVDEFNEGDENIEEDREGADGDQSQVEDELLDSDYEIRPEDDPEFGDVNYAGDDEEFKKYVDNEDVLEEYADMGYVGEISDNSNDTEELGSLQESSGEDDGNGVVTSKVKKKRVKGRTWIAERDMKNPYFEIGQVFANVVQFRDAVKKFAVKNGYNLSF